MQNHDKRAKYTILWLFLYVTAKMKVKWFEGATISSNFGLSELQPQALQPLPTGKLCWKSK